MKSSKVRSIDVREQQSSHGDNASEGNTQHPVRRASAEELRKIACDYDWRLFPEEVLGWVMAQKCIDLASALTAFLNGEPERFNYIPKRDVPAEHRPTTRVLDNICLRVNSGFYLSSESTDMADLHRLNRWLRYQQADRNEGRRGRWILDERIIDGLNRVGALRGRIVIPGENATDLFQPAPPPAPQPEEPRPQPQSDAA